MQELDRLLAELSALKAEQNELGAKVSALLDVEAQVRKDIENYMLDNQVEKKTSPDGKWSASLTVRTRVTVNDKPGLVAYAIEKRTDLLSVDLVRAKSGMKDDPEIKQFFRTEKNTGIIVSEVKEVLKDIETPSQFKERVRAMREAGL